MLVKICPPVPAAVYLECKRLEESLLKAAAGSVHTPELEIHLYPSPNGGINALLFGQDGLRASKLFWAWVWKSDAVDDFIRYADQPLPQLIKKAAGL